MRSPAARKRAGAQEQTRNEGEGSRSADEDYRAGLEAFESDEERVERAAREAARATEGDEGAELRDAEQKGKQPSKNRPH